MSKQLLKIVKQGTGQQSYSFCLFNIPPDSGRVLWQLTNTCNYHCSYCIFASGPKKYHSELDTDRSIELIRELKELGFAYIKFTGGEPFVRKDIMLLLKKVEHLEIDFDISTNAALVSSTVANELARLRPQYIHVSIDGHTQAIHEAARGERTFEPSIRGLKLLAAAGVQLRVGSIIFKNNQFQLEALIELAVEHQAQKIAFSLLKPAGRIAGNYDMCATRPKSELLEELNYLQKKYQDSIQVQHNLSTEVTDTVTGSCPGGSKFIFIDHLGYVSPCTWVVKNNANYRSDLSLTNASLDQILRSQAINSYRKYIAEEFSNGKLGCPISW